MLRHVAATSSGAYGRRLDEGGGWAHGLLRIRMARIVIPLADDFEDSEYSIPYGRLREAGHDVTVVGRGEGEVVEGKRGEATVPVDAAAASVDAASFDLLLIPGGWSP